MSLFPCPFAYRSALENALTVAALLNRTLILPPLYLGHAGVLSWRHNRALQFALRQVETTNFNRLHFSSDNMERPLRELISADTPIAVVPWSALLDFRRLPAGVRVVEVADFVDAHVLRGGQDVWEVGDRSRYSYRLFDTIPGAQHAHIFNNAHNRNALERMVAPRYRWFVVNGTRCWRTVDEAATDDSQRRLSIRYVSGFIRLAKVSGDQPASASPPSLRTEVNTIHTYTEDIPQLDTPSATVNLPMCNTLRGRHIANVDAATLDNIATTTVLTSDGGTLTIIPMAKYAYTLNLENIDAAFASDNGQGPPRLLFFGSLFGRDRLHLITERAIRIRAEIEESLTYHRGITHEVADEIVGAMHGPGSFMAAHIRAGDGGFVRKLKSTVDNVVTTLGQLLGERQNNTVNAVTGIANITNDTRASPLPPLPTSTIFIATDLRDSDTSTTTLFEPLRRHFTHIRTLADFPAQLRGLNRLGRWRLEKLREGTITPAWESEMTLLLDAIAEARAVRYDRDSIDDEEDDGDGDVRDDSNDSEADDEEAQEQLYGSMARFLLGLRNGKQADEEASRARAVLSSTSTPPNPAHIRMDDPLPPAATALSPYARLWLPFVDQFVCSQARSVVGTAGSTFSAYVERSHMQFWNATEEQGSRAMFSR